MIAMLQTNPYIESTSHYESLTDSLKLPFLESLYTLLTTQKAIIFSKFLQAHPYFESYLITQDIQQFDLSFLANSHHVIYAVMQKSQEYLPNIIFDDKSAKEQTLGIVLYEPFSESYKEALREQVRMHKNKAVQFYLCTQEFFAELSLALQLQQHAKTEDLHANFIESLLRFGLTLHASDIHLGYKDSLAFCALRLDGILVDFFTIHPTLFIKISQKLKLLCKLDINEARLPQDGHIKFENILYKGAEQTCDVRLSFLPTLHSESIVLRIPHANTHFASLETLGLQDELLAILKQALFAKSGLILIGGPTGSGKSTLLYNCLRFLHNGTKKIITIEDPIEQEIHGITQAQVNEELQFSFAKALKYILRQDPDIIMVGEIRDYETLEIALRAALTGHLVLASLHANDCYGSLARLRELGAKEYILQATLRLIVAQRLIQTLCPFCKQESENGFYAQGCHKCYGQGSAHRILLQEVLDLRAKEAYSTSLYEGIETLMPLFRGLPSLQQQATRLFHEGIISYEESLL